MDYVSFELQHSSGETFTFAPTSQKDGKANFMIDFTNAARIDNLNGEYHITVKCAASGLKSFSWKAGSVVARFISSTKVPVVSEPPRRYVPQDITEKQANPILPLIFCGFIFASLVAYMTQLANLNASFKNFPFNLSSLLFVASILLVLGLFVLFWVSINLIQLLTILLVLTPPLLIIGNQALNSVDPTIPPYRAPTESKKKK